MKILLQRVALFTAGMLFMTGLFADPVTVTVKKSDGTTALSGVSISYFDGFWKGLGNTNGSGQVNATVPAGTWNFKADFAGSSKTIASVVVSGATSVNFQTVLAAVQVNKSTGSPLSGASVEYYSGFWRGIGNSNGSGQVSCELFSGATFQFRATYAGSTATSQTMDLSTGGNNLTFATVLADVQVNKSDATPLSGAAVEYYSGFWRGIGNSNGSGEITCELFSGASYPFRATYAGSTATSQTMDLTLGGNNLTFATVLADVQVNKSDATPLSGAAVEYYSGFWRGIGNSNGSGEATCQLFPGASYTFRATYAGSTATGQIMDLTLGGNSLTFATVLAEVQVNKSDATPLSGAAVEYYSGFWRGIGNSNGSGEATCQLFPGATYAFRVKYAGSTAADQTMDLTVGGNSLTYYTTLVTVNVETCAGIDIAGSSVEYYSGFWRGIGNTNGSGQATCQLFAGTYDFKATIGGTVSSNNSVVVTGDGSTASVSVSTTFKPTQVTITHPGTKQYYAGFWRGFTGTIYLFPGTYNFKLGGIEAALSISGCIMSQTAIIVKLNSSTNAPLSGGTVQYYSGGWQNVGTTGTNGAVLFLVNGTPGNMLFSMTYGFGRQEKTQNVGSNQVVVFQTTNVKMEVRNEANQIGVLPNEASGLQYYAGGWRTFGSGATTAGSEVMELLPLNYTFALTYAYGRQEKTQNVNTNSVVVYNTQNVTMELRNEAGDIDVLPNEASGLQYYAGGWRTFGSGATTDGDETMELLPLNYSFAMTYGFARQEKTQNISVNDIVVYNTKNVTMELRDEAGDIDVLPNEATGLQYYAGGWRTFGAGATTDGAASMEMLPMSYAFAMTYAYARQEKTQNVSSNSTVVYNTKIVNLEVLDHNDDIGTLPYDATNLQYYAGGWRTFGSGTTTSGDEVMELLPMSYAFALTYAYARQEKTQNVSTSDVVSFKTTMVTVRLEDGSAAGIDNGTASYYAGGWRSFGITGTAGSGNAEMELLPMNYAFRMVYATKTKEKTETISGTTDNVKFVYSAGTLSRVATNTNNILTDKVNEQISTESNAGDVATPAVSSSATQTKIAVPVVSQIKCYPNPFATETIISYNLTSDQFVNIEIYNTNGAKVMSLVNQMQLAGNNVVTLSGNDLTSGIYYVRITTAQGTQQVPVVLNK